MEKWRREHPYDTPPYPFMTSPTSANSSPKKQGTCYRQTHCGEQGCEFTVRVAASHVRNIGPPHCPRHGEMKVDLPDSDVEEDEEKAEAA